ncbi:MAG: biotin/lipoyl-containing protein [Planctomycetota bacterium]|jgi:acetyl-CoA carboxylase biotin carboxyl carrier protein|nr:biotin/lipoyl-containing protein [Planctomycetota bacterium]
MEVRALELLFKPSADGEGWSLHCPAVGRVIDLPMAGVRLVPGRQCGAIDILGVRHHLVVPSGVAGFVSESADRSQRLQSCGYGELLFTAQEATDAVASAFKTAADADESAGHYICAAQDGRFYQRPDPDSPPFVKVGDEIEYGRTVGLLEVMKTFSPVKYAELPGHPPHTRVKAILVADNSDVEDGQALIEIEA